MNLAPVVDWNIDRSFGRVARLSNRQEWDGENAFGYLLGFKEPTGAIQKREEKKS